MCLLFRSRENRILGSMGCTCFDLSVAEVFGEPGRSATVESSKRFLRFTLIAFVAIGVGGGVAGFALGSLFPVKAFSPLLVLAVEIVAGGALFILSRRTFKKMEDMDRERITWRKGAVGEDVVGRVLDGLPDGFYVIHDVSNRLGNIDHIVIGPTRIYVVDSKNWKGTVKTNGHGELLLNGRPTSKPEIKKMAGAVMGFREKMIALTGKEYYVNGIMVFPISYLEGTSGNTRPIHCIGEDQLVEYIQNKDFEDRLPWG